MSELYALPEGWEWKKITDIASISNKTVNIDDDHLYNCVGLENIESNTGKLVDFTPMSGNEIKSSKVVFEKDMVLYGKLRPYLNKVWKAEFDGVATTEIIPFKPDSNILEASYLAHFLMTDYFIANAMNNISGARMPRITTKYLKNEAYIPLPPLQEQKRIVAKLDSLFERIDRAIALHQQNIDEAEGLMGSALDAVFGELDTDLKTSLKEITTKIGSGATPKGGQKSYKTEGISLIRSMNVHDTGFKEKGLAFIDEEQAQKLSNVIVEENDILLNITGASVARCCIVDKNYLPARVNQHVSIIRLKEGMLPKFLHYYIISPAIKSDLLFSSSGGATREAITKTMLQNFEVPQVSMDIQQKTVQYLDALSQKVAHLKEVQQEKTEQLKALKASILDRAFRGEL